MAEAALARLTATAARVLKDSWEITAKPVGHITLVIQMSELITHGFHKHVLSKKITTLYYVCFI